MNKNSFRFVLILLIILCSVNIVLGDSDSYSQEINIGENLLVLNTAYDSNHVSGIEGNFIHMADYSFQKVKIDITNEIGNNLTLKINVTYEEGMNPDFSNVYFKDLNENIIPSFRNTFLTVNETSSIFYIFLENASASTELIMVWGQEEAEQEHDVFFNKYVYPSGYTYSPNSYLPVYSSNSLYGVTGKETGNYRNADLIFSLTGSGSSHASAPWIRLYGTGTAWSGAVGIWKESNVLYPLITGWYNSGITPGNDGIVYLNKSVNSANSQTVFDLKYGSNSQKYSNSATTTDRFSFTGTGSMKLYFAVFYNSTEYTIEYGETEEYGTGIERITKVSINCPEDTFDTLVFTSDEKGTLKFEINYSPHVIIQTQNETTFSYGTANLSYLAVPQNFEAYYEISKTPDFSDIIISETENTGTTKIVNNELKEGEYYWRVKQGDGTWSQITQFQISPTITLHGHVIDGVTGEYITYGKSFASETIGPSTTTVAVSTSYVNSYVNSGKVIFSQAGVIKNLTFNNSDASFVVEEIQFDAPFTITIPGGNNFAQVIYELTIPSGSPQFELNFSAFRNISSTTTATYGIVYDQYGTGVSNAHVSFSYSNGTIKNTIYTQQGGQYALLNTAGEHIVRYQASGYSEKSGVITGPARQDVMLDSTYNISVSIIDEETGSSVKSFSTYLGKNQTLKSTDNGTVEYTNMSGGSQELIIQAAGYNQITKEIFIKENSQHFTIKVSKTDTSYYEPHVAQFMILENKTGFALKGVNVSVYSGDIQLYSQKTGDDGSVSFKLSKNTSYKFIFSDSNREIHKEVNLTPTNYFYAIYVDTNKNQTAFDYNYNRYIIFNELEAVQNPEIISSIGFDNESVSVVLRYSVYNHKNDKKMVEKTTVQQIDKTGTKKEVNADLIVQDGSSIHYYISIPKGIEPGSIYRFTTTGSHADAKDSLITLTKDWKVTFSQIKPEFDIFSGNENYYAYVAIFILFIIVGALALSSTVLVAILITSVATLFFIWIGWLNLPTSAIVFLFLALIIFILKTTYRS